MREINLETHSSKYRYGCTACCFCVANGCVAVISYFFAPNKWGHIFHFSNTWWQILFCMFNRQCVYNKILNKIKVYSALWITNVHAFTWYSLASFSPTTNTQENHFFFGQNILIQLLHSMYSFQKLYNYLHGLAFSSCSPSVLVKLRLVHFPCCLKNRTTSCAQNKQQTNATIPCFFNKPWKTNLHAQCAWICTRNPWFWIAVIIFASNAVQMCFNSKQIIHVPFVAPQQARWNPIWCSKTW